MRSKSYIFGVFITLCGGILWGFSGACGQYLFMFHGVSADWLVPYRLLLSGAMLLIFLALKSPKTLFAPLLKPQNIPTLLFYSLIGLMMTQYSYFYSIELSNAAVATVLQYTAPIFTLAIVCIKEQRLPFLKEFIALILAILGVFLLCTHAQPSTLVISPKALAFCLISALCVVVYNFAAQRLNQIYGIELVLGWGLLLGGVVLAIYMRLWELPGVSSVSGYLALFGVVFLGTVLAFSFYLWGVSLIGPARASLVAASEPVAAAIFSSFWLGVSFVGYDYLGFLLIMLCVAMLFKKDKNGFKHKI